MPRTKFSASFSGLLAAASAACAPTSELADFDADVCGAYAAIIGQGGWEQGEIFVIDCYDSSEEGCGAREGDEMSGLDLRDARFNVVGDINAEPIAVGDDLWDALDAAAAAHAGEPLPCAPSDFGVSNAAMVSESTGEVVHPDGSRETLEYENSIYFDAIYPRRGLAWRFSPLGLSADGREALVSGSYFCGGLCAAGSLYLLRRDTVEDDWAIAATTTIWMS